MNPEDVHIRLALRDGRSAVTYVLTMPSAGIAREAPAPTMFTAPITFSRMEWVLRRNFVACKDEGIL